MFIYYPCWLLWCWSNLGVVSARTALRRRLWACCWCSTGSPREWSGEASTHASSTAPSGYPFHFCVEKNCCCCQPCWLSATLLISSVRAPVLPAQSGAFCPPTENAAVPTASRGTQESSPPVGQKTWPGSSPRGPGFNAWCFTGCLCCLVKLLDPPGSDLRPPSRKHQRRRK